MLYTQYKGGGYVMVTSQEMHPSSVDVRACHRRVWAAITVVKTRLDWTLVNGIDGRKLCRIGRSQI